MSAIVWDDVIAHAPELSGVDEDAQTDILAHVNTTLNVAVFGGEESPKLRLARIYLAAHMTTLMTLGSSSGDIASESVGGVSYSASSTTSTGSFDTTGYGKQYQALVRNSVARFPLVV
jgi:hypothetical protein